MIELNNDFYLFICKKHITFVTLKKNVRIKEVKEIFSDWLDKLHYKRLTKCSFQKIQVNNITFAGNRINIEYSIENKNKRYEFVNSITKIGGEEVTILLEKE